MRRPDFDPRTSNDAEYAEEALELARAWADGRRSWTNLQTSAHRDEHRRTVAVEDAAEVIKWAALGQALAVAESAERQRDLAEAIAERAGLFG